MDPDPAYHFDVGPDPAYHSDADPDPTFKYDADLCEFVSAILKATFILFAYTRLRPIGSAGR